MLESKIESDYCKKVKEKGGIAIKLVSPSFVGLPDRLILLPDQIFYFVEFKAPGKKPTKIQEVIHGRLKKLGFQVYVIDAITQLSDSGHPAHSK